MGSRAQLENTMFRRRFYIDLKKGQYLYILHAYIDKQFTAIISVLKSIVISILTYFLLDALYEAKLYCHHLAVQKCWTGSGQSGEPPDTLRSGGIHEAKTFRRRA
ncbi:hypothetical protein GCM10007094_18060 [Pseudovibrio japonicus]|uniref:Uncharacterized protein n=1 Tax=Pseudovibrio japonicus TaxID=366534 RepID=A0ABQ3E8X4_9HYPH|nr:hypothetical protein GCM10007094_18060 [Pseudovibrio japonicus]